MNFSKLILSVIVAGLGAFSATAAAPGDSLSAKQPTGPGIVHPEYPAAAERFADKLTLPGTTKSVTLDLQECIRLALDANPTVRVADMEVTKVEWAKKETRSALFPTIDFSAAYQRAIELQTVSMDMGGQTQSLKMGTDNTWNFGFSASLPLVAPQLWKSLKVSDIQILQNLESARASRLDLINQISHAYYSLMLAYASHEVLVQNYDRAVFNASLYEKQYSVGTASEYDVLRSQVQVKNCEPDILQAEIAIKSAKLQLLVLMGLAPTVDVLPANQLKDYEREMYVYIMGDRVSLEYNTQLRSLDLQTELLEKNVEIKKLAWVPTLGASFNLSWNAMTNGNAFTNVRFNPYSTVGLALNVPIFSGGSKYYGLKQAEVQLKEMQFQRENLVNNLSMQRDIALDNINKEVKQISTCIESMKQADKAYSIMQKSFEIGAATYLDLRDAELATTTSQLAYYQAIYNYLNSVADLDLLTGKEDDMIRAGYDPQVHKAAYIK